MAISLQQWTLKCLYYQNLFISERYCDYIRSCGPQWPITQKILKYSIFLCMPSFKHISGILWVTFTKNTFLWRIDIKLSIHVNFVNKIPNRTQKLTCCFKNCPKSLKDFFVYFYPSLFWIFMLTSANIMALQKRIKLLLLKNKLFLKIHLLLENRTYKIIC